jgi:TolB-like protein
VSALALASCIALPLAANAQCPDGTPPPCAGERRAAARRAPPPPAARARSFLLLPFRNVTRAEGQDWLVDGAPLMLADALGQFRDLTVVSGERQLAARRRLGLAEGAAPDATQLRRLADETGGWTAVGGSVFATGGRLRITAQALDAVTGSVLVRAEVEVAADADVRPAFDQLAVRLLEVAGLPPQTTDVAALTTRSLDAYRAYVLGVTLTRQSAFRRAQAAFREAVRLDSTFAYAWARMALAGSAWNLTELMNPMSPTYTAVERAVSLSARLPPRQAAGLRLMAAFFRGRLAAARQLADSLNRTDPEDLDIAEFLALFEMIDPMLDTTTSPPRLRASFNRMMVLARHTLERDPGRRYAFGAIGYAYATAGGLWGGALQGVRREAGSFAAVMMGSTEAEFVPVLRDSFEMLPKAAFDSLPEAERARLRRRAAEAGMQWMERWLAAGPGDADAHLWTSRMAELLGDWPRALRETELADSLGVESQMENVTGRRLMLLVRTDRLAAAGALADSLAAAGALRRSFLPVVDRGWHYGAAALLLTGRFSRAAALAAAAGSPGGGAPACRRLLEVFDRGLARSLPEGLIGAIRDSLAAHAPAFGAEPVLAPCLPAVQEGRPPQ